MVTTAMKALVKDGSSLAVRKREVPVVSSDYHVLVRVAMAGLCRTDLYAAEGAIPVADPVILGHEMSGVVEETGAAVEAVSPGNRVTINPLLACGRCEFCLGGLAQRCQATTFLGVDRDGAFAELALVPAATVTRLPDDTSFIAAAYAEPVAASLAVLKTGIAPSDRGLLIGQNRFSRLMARVLETQGFTDVATWSPRGVDDADPEAAAYDFVIETMATDRTLRAMVTAVRPGGKLILKSRQPAALTINLIEMIRKEPVIYPVNYGSFEDAVAFIVNRRVLVEDLVDGIYPLEEFSDVFARAAVHEELKPFFALSDVS